MYAIDKSTAFTYPDGCVSFKSYGPWRSLAAFSNCLCEDGNRRAVRITGEPDTFFSVPARCKVSGRTVSGFVTYRDWPVPNGSKYGESVPVFVATGKNRHMIPAEYARMVGREMERARRCVLQPRDMIWDSVEHDFY